MWRWRSALHRPGLRLAAVGAVGAAVLAPGFPLMTGAIAPDHRPVLPSTHVSVPAYWTAMASYLNRSAPPGNLLVLPQDDFYQMPYTWGYYGADGFITDLIARNVVDPVAQGYAPASQELAGAVSLVQQGLLAHDWPSVQRTLAAIGTPLLLVRGDVNAAFPGRHITSPAALDEGTTPRQGHAACPSFRKARAVRASREHQPGGLGHSVRHCQLCYAGSARPGAFALRDRADIKPDAAGRSRGAAVSACFTMAARRRRTRDLYRRAARPAVPRSSCCQPPARPSHPGAGSSASRGARRSPAHPPAVRQRDGQVVEELSYKLGGSLLSDGDFASGPWGAVGNCAAFPGTAATARLAARVLPGQGPAGQSALALSAKADSACEARSLAWRSGPLFVSLWVRNVSGAAPRMCLWETPIEKCAAMSPLPSNSAPSRWYHYQTIVTPDPGTRSLSLFLYADVYTPGALTTNEYSDVVVRRSPVLLQPVVVATPRGARAPGTSALHRGRGFLAELDRAARRSACGGRRTA